jgi:hypothetical protein
MWIQEQEISLYLMLQNLRGNSLNLIEITSKYIVF